MQRPLAIIAVLLCACGSSPSGPDAGDAGAPDAAAPPAPDAGVSTGCAEEGQPCGAGTTCCTITCADGSELAVNVCDPSGLCLPNLDDAGATPSCPGGGGADGGFSFDAGPPDDCVVWLPQVVTAQVATLRDLALPAGQPPIAAGTGSGVGQLVVGPLLPALADAGALDAGAACGPIDAGPPQSWTAFAGAPPASVLAGVFEGPTGDVFAVGQAAGSALWLAGSLDGGLVPLPLDAGLATSLLSVTGVGPGEAVAVGLAPGGPAALHLYPDGGLWPEPVAGNGGVTVLYKVAGLAGGPLLALGEAPGPAGAPPAALALFLRGDGGWSPVGAPAGAAVLHDLSVAPNGDVWLAGDDGVGDGLAYAWSLDGGFAAVDLGAFSAVAPLRAVAELPGGDLLLAAVPDLASNPTGTPAEMLRWSGGAWSHERMPGLTVDVTAIAGGASETVAVGAQACSDCDGGQLPLVLVRQFP